MQQGQICKLKQKLYRSTKTCKNLSKLSSGALIDQIEKIFSSVGSTFLKSQFKNMNNKRPTWNFDDKVFAIALYKRGPRSYRFLQRFVKLPSRATIMNFLKTVPFNTGINKDLFFKLQKRIVKMPKTDRIATLMFDEVSLSPNLTYCKIVRIIIYGTRFTFKLEATNLLFFYQRHCKSQYTSKTYY